MRPDTTGTSHDMNYDVTTDSPGRFARFQEPRAQAVFYILSEWNQLDVVITRRA